MALEFGEVDWNSGDVGSAGSKINFLKLEQGTTTVRILGNPHQYYIHWLVMPDGSKKKINSPISDPALLKQLEEMDFGRKPRWLLKVLDRSDNTFKLLEIGNQIYNGIRALYNNPKWGKVTSYDVDILRAKPGTNPLYAVQPNPKEELPASLKKDFVEFNESINLEALTKPADPAEVRAMLGLSSGSKSSAAASSQSKAPVEDDSDFNFEFN
jgi:hypothetical protein